MTDALRDAALLARELDSGGSLARYETLRDDYALPILEITDAIASFDWDFTSVAELHKRFNQELARELELVRSLASGARPARAA